MDSIAEQIIKELGRHEADWCFSPKDFLELAGRDALDKAFSRLTADGKIRLKNMSTNLESREADLPVGLSRITGPHSTHPVNF